MHETIGQRLKKECEARFLTLDKASEETRIRKVFLEALEADDFSVMPSAAQGRGFLRNYARYLELNIDEIIAEIQRNAPKTEEVSGPLPRVNLDETELPPLVAKEEQQEDLSWVGKLRVSVTSWLGFGRMEETPLQVEGPQKEAELESSLRPTQGEIVVEEVVVAIDAGDEDIRSLRNEMVASLVDAVVEAMLVASECQPSTLPQRVADTLPELNETCRRLAADLIGQGARK